MHTYVCTYVYQIIAFVSCYEIEFIAANMSIYVYTYMYVYIGASISWFPKYRAVFRHLSNETCLELVKSQAFMRIVRSTSNIATVGESVSDVFTSRHSRELRLSYRVWAMSIGLKRIEACKDVVFHI